MNVIWSPHARHLLGEILTTITDERSIEDAYTWRNKIDETILPIADFPQLGPSVPLVCFFIPPPNPERLRQVICEPYRIVYEVTDSACYVLSIRHTRMKLGSDDTTWH